MAEEISLNPTPPATAEDKSKVSSTKRPRDDGDAAENSTGWEVPPPKRRAVLSQDILYRIMLPSRHIGKVIGSKGSRIQQIREETKATIKIADAVSRHEERVIIISSKDSENPFTDAENALHKIASLIVKDDRVDPESLKMGPGHVAANTLRLLIAGTQAGGLIGVSGQNIENLRNSSGATITVLAQNQLPLCASAHESDRVVQLSGDVMAVLKAVVQIGCQLRDNPPKQVISISPSYSYALHRPLQHVVDPSSAEYVTIGMMISESMIGGLIGRCGSNISRIRTESGASIKVHGGKGEQNLRQINLGGSAQQVALARQRIDEYIYSQLMQQNGGQQSVALGAGTMTTQPPIFMPPVANPNQAPAYYAQPFGAPHL